MANKKISCHVVEDLFPLYLENQTNEETTELIENHLAECDRCRQVSQDISKNIFSEISEEQKNNYGSPEDKGEDKKYLLKVRRALLFFIILVFALILIFTASSYFLGKNTGEYSQRFELAEDNNLFIEVNNVKEFGGKNIALEKILLDHSLTTIILNTELDLSEFDSITLKDNLENYYRKAFTFPGNPLVELQSEDNHYILDFYPVVPEAEKLILELIKYKGEIESRLTFEIVLKAEKRPISSLPQYSDLLNTELEKGVRLTIEQLKAGISNSEVIITFNYADTVYDAIDFGWYNQEQIRNLDPIMLQVADAEPLAVLALQDITLESMTPEEIEKIPPKPRYQTYKVLTEPIPRNEDSLALQIKNLYAVHYLDNAEFTLDFSHKNTAELNYVYSTDQIQIDLHSAVKKDNRIRLYYEIKTKQGEMLPAYVLDARIKKMDDKYDVPLQGKPLSEEGRKYLEFPDLGTSQYTLYLSRTGHEINSSKLTLELP